MEKSQRPLKGDGAYDFNPNSQDDFINKGNFGYVFRCIRGHDLEKFAIKISKNKLFMLGENEKQDLF